MASQEDGGALKHAANKIADTVGGVVGQMSAATTATAAGFAENAAIGDLYEIQSGAIAFQRASSDAVRLAATQMIADHMTSSHHLQAALSMNETIGVAPPPLELDSRRAGMIQHLEEAPDAAFDATYLDQQVLAHEETVTLMRNYGDSGDNPQLRSFAIASAPVVERHLDHMKHLRSALAA